MSLLTGLFAAWGVVTIVFLVLVIYRSRLSKKETDWISLSDDAKEDQAIKAQTVIEGETKKLDLPIRTLGTISVIMLLVVIGVWVYKGIMTPPSIPK
jgi:hypothetical protein